MFKYSTLLLSLTILHPLCAQKDTIYVEFCNDSWSDYHDSNKPHQTSYYYTYADPDPNLDLITQRNDTTSFTGVLVADYYWRNFLHRKSIYTFIDGDLTHKYTVHSGFCPTNIKNYLGDFVITREEYVTDSTLLIKHYSYGRLTFEENTKYNLKTNSSHKIITSFEYNYLYSFMTPDKPLRLFAGEVIDSAGIKLSISYREDHSVLSKQWETNTSKITEIYDYDGEILIKEELYTSPDKIEKYFMRNPDFHPQKYYQEYTKINGQFDGNYIDYINDSLTIHFIYNRGNLLDILIDSIVYIGEKNAIISESEFIDLYNSRPRGACYYYTALDFNESELINRKYKYIFYIYQYEGTYPKDKLITDFDPGNPKHRMQVIEAIVKKQLLTSHKK